MAGVVSRDYADRTDRWQAAHIVIAQDDKERGHADILP
jgi:hypothetical protein